jgi:phosphoribosyl-AMP cyclohydrolase / phosphoribosyl-ATP pyrophosphohydrolase
MNNWTDTIRFDEQGLVPAVVQDVYRRSIDAGLYEPRILTEDAGIWRDLVLQPFPAALWHKGETSGHVLRIRQILYDCDGDTLLLKVDPAGPTCHTGKISCFYRSGWQAEHQKPEQKKPFIFKLDEIIAQRQMTGTDDSYTARLLAAGRDRILRKVGEESGEVIIAGKNDDPAELAAEMADLWYHCLVLLRSAGLNLTAVDQELARRHGEGEAR